LEIARGLIHNPEVLFLDEPTLGLDAQTRRRIWDYIKELNKKEKITIFLTTHYMEEADFLCDRIAIIDNGKIIARGTSKKLKNLLGGDVISLEIKKTPGKLKKMLETCTNCKWIKKVKAHNNHLSLTVQNAETKVTKVLKLAEKAGIDIISVSIRKPSLEDVFIHFTGKTIREAKPENFQMKMMAMRRGH